jgi:hypothetical protein
VLSPVLAFPVGTVAEILLGLVKDVTGPVLLVLVSASVIG